MSEINNNKYKISEEKWYKKNIAYWALYDLGNTIFSMVVVSLAISPLVYIMYYNKIGGDGSEAINLGNFSVSLVLLIGNLMMAIISPFLGAYSDYKEKRNTLLMKISIVCIGLMAALIISAFSTSVVLILIIFLFANLFYQAGLVVYDSMLPFITDEDKVGRVSGMGIALGYFGSFVGIGLGYALLPIFGDFYTQPGTATTPARFEFGYLPYIFPFAAFMFFMFAIPMFFVKEKPQPSADIDSSKIFKGVTEQVIKTTKEIYNYKDTFIFIIGWLIFVDAANTVILFMTPMVSVGLEFGESSVVLGVLGIGIGSAVAFTYFVGKFVDKYGPKKGILLVTFLWTSSLLIGVFTNLHIGNINTPTWPVYVFPLIVGPAMGGSWVVQRQYITELAPTAKVGNYFGFANIFGRISAAIGPSVWATSIYILNKGFKLPITLSTRFAIFVLIFLMLIGFAIIFFGVTDPHTAYVNGARATGDGRWIDENTGNEVLQSKHIS